MVVHLRRKPARRVVWMAALLALACQREPGKQTKVAPQSGQTSPAGIDGQVLAASLKRGVQRVSDNSGSYRIDGFVGVLLQQHLSSQTAGSEGIEVGKAAPGSLLGELGLQSGDRLLAVNGTPLAGLGKAEITAAFAGGRDQIALAVVRDGVTSNFEYHVVDSLAWRGAQQPVEPVHDPVVDLSVAMPEQPDPFAEAAAGRGSGPSGAGRPPSGSGRAPSSGRAPAGRGSSSGRTPLPSGGNSNAGTSNTGAKTSARCQGSNCSVSMQEFSRYTNNPSLLMREAQVSRVAQGYRLRSVRPAGPVGQLGFRNGDIITTVNGHRLNDDGDAMALYFGLSGTRTFRVTYLRSGRPATRTIRLQ